MQTTSARLHSQRSPNTPRAWPDGAFAPPVMQALRPACIRLALSLIVSMAGHCVQVMRPVPESELFAGLKVDVLEQMWIVAQPLKRS